MKKNWISLTVVAGLMTGCGVVKHASSQSNSSPSASQIPAQTQSQSSDFKAGFDPSSLPKIGLNNLNSAPAAWPGVSTIPYKVIGRFKKSETQATVAFGEERMLYAGTLSFTRTQRKYDSIYRDSDLQPKITTLDEDHPEIQVYFAEIDSEPNSVSLLISEADFQTLLIGEVEVTVPYDVQLMCRQWKVPPADDPYHLFANSCLGSTSEVTCQAFGECTSTCPVPTFSLAEFQAQMLNVENPNCEKNAEFPVKSAQLSNQSIISQYRIQANRESRMKASQLTFSGGSF